MRPSQRAFSNAYNLLRFPSITSETQETIFQILNQTVWTNNEAFESQMRPDPNCERCGEVETMKHLLCECEYYYSELLWNRLAKILTKLININTTDPVPRVDLGQTNIIYNIPHPSILLYILDKITGNILLLLIQDIKRDTVSYSEE